MCWADKRAVMQRTRWFLGRGMPLWVKRPDVGSHPRTNDLRLRSAACCFREAGNLLGSPFVGLAAASWATVQARFRYAESS